MKQDHEKDLGSAQQKGTLSNTEQDFYNKSVLVKRSSGGQ